MGGGEGGGGRGRDGTGWGRKKSTMSVSSNLLVDPVLETAPRDEETNRFPLPLILFAQWNHRGGEKVRMKVPVGSINQLSLADG